MTYRSYIGSCTLYYGGGSCTIQGDEIYGLEINYEGKIHITDKTQDNCLIVAGKKKIIIVSLMLIDHLEDLFEYNGYLKIKSAIVANKDGEKVFCAIKKSMDHAELMDSNPEDMTVVSENLNTDYSSGNIVKETKVDKTIIENQYTSGEKLYKSDGTEYIGDYHIHIYTLALMTGAKHDDSSEDLYAKDSIPESLVPVGVGK